MLLEGEAGNEKACEAGAIKNGDRIIVFTGPSRVACRSVADIRFLGRRRLQSAVRRLQSESGQVTVVIAMLSVALFSSLALAADVGAGYASRRALQTSVDAAALAGAAEIAEGRGEAAARAMAADYLAKNVGPRPDARVDFPAPDKVRVATSLTQETFFARLLGRRGFQVTASATASFMVASTVENLVPIIVPEQSVLAHIGPANEVSYELGEDRPLDGPSIEYKRSGQRVTYTVEYTNTSKNVETVDMRSPVPPGSKYARGSATGGGDSDDREVKWHFDRVASGDKRSASFDVDFERDVKPDNTVEVDITDDSGGKKKEHGSTGESQRGYFWLVDFDGGSHGTPDFEDWIENGYPKPVKTGDLANGTGVRSALKTSLDKRKAKDPKVVLPLYDYTKGGGSNGTYHVVGFAEFVLTDSNLTGNPKTVSGYFTNGTVTAGSAADSNAPDYGVRVIWLSD